MDRIHDILNSVNQTVSNAAQKTYKGQKRSELKDSDFLFPETRSFPIVSPSDIPDAINNFGRMKGPMSYDAFLKKLYNMAKRKGPEFVDAFPSATKDKLGIKSKSEYDEEEDDDDSPEEREKEKLEDKLELELVKKKLKETKAEEDFTEVEEEEESPEMEMMEYKNDFYQMSIGSLRAIMQHSRAIIEALDNPNVKENLTESWLQGKIAITEDYMRTIHDFVMFVSEGKIKADSYNDINQFELGPSTMKNLDDLYGDDEENDHLNDTNAATNALKQAHSCAGIMLDKVADPMVTQRLTSAWKEGKIDAACKSMGQLHDFVMNVPLADDDKTLVAEESEDYDSTDLPIDTKSVDRPGLWENIRKKKEREGKKYRPAKPGDKDRPDPETWKKLTK